MENGRIPTILHITGAEPGYIAAGVIATGIAFGAGYASRTMGVAVIGAATSIGTETTSR